MAKFLFIYHGGKAPESEEEGQKVMAAWGKWFEDLGPAVVDPGDPVGPNHTVSADGHVDNGGANPASGYGIFEFDDHDAACAAAAKNPMLHDGSGATVEVAQIFHLEM